MKLIECPCTIKNYLTGYSLVTEYIHTSQIIRMVWKKTAIALVWLCSSFCLSYGQYTGGAEDGFSQFILSRTSITDEDAFRGGVSDGFSLVLSTKENITDADAFRGGNDDGFTQNLLLKISITDGMAFLGGLDDGFHQSLMSKLNITDGNVFKGGLDDGFSQTVLPKLSITDATAFTGGLDDGFSQTFLQKLNITDANAFLGGHNDGFALVNLLKSNITDTIVFYGGNGRGETQKIYSQLICNGDTVKWNGNVSTQWENAGNWDCGVMPSINSNVIIPSGRPNYPIISFAIEIKSMYLQSGTTVTVLPGVLFKLNGQ